MRKTWKLWALAVAAVALVAIPPGLAFGSVSLRRLYEVQGAASPVTRAVPTTSSTFLSIADARSYRVEVCAPAGQTLSGAGKLAAYLWVLNFNGSPILSRGDVSADCTIPPEAAGHLCYTCDGYQTVVNPGDGVLYAAEGVTFSGGSGLRVQVDLVRGN
jgi:hypothetical protein